MCQYLNYEYFNLNKVIIPLKNEWKMEEVNNCSKQNDNNSCGVHVCINSDLRSQDLPVEYPFDGVPAFRKRIALSILEHKHPFFLKNLISDRCKEILTLATPSIAIILTRYFIRFSNSWLYDLLTISFVLAQSWQSWQSLHFLYSFSYVGYKSFFTVSYYTFFHIFVTCFLCMFVTLFSCIFVAIFFCIVVTFSSLNWR